MRRSRVLEKLRTGQAVSSVKLNIDNARVAEIAALAGIDCLWLDQEHVASDWSVVEAQILAAKVYDVDVMVRVARGSYSDYVRPLELDATGIMVPHVMSLEDARTIVRLTKFQPLGRRPLDSGNADGAYGQTNLKDYLKWANEERFLMLQIEDPEPLPELDAIAALPGVDILFFGPGDFAHAVGAPGDWQNPALIEARQRVVEAARSHGKFAGTSAAVAGTRELLALGYRFLGIGADVIGLSGYFRKLAADFTALDAGRG
jgi:4-hydroxy-2-oxoheptanedioate aldolase